MKADRKILEILEANNPFSSNAAGDPREDRYPDVPGLGDEAFSGIRNLIRFKKNEPAKHCAGAVTGEAGVGKTHLIGRLIDDCDNESNPYCFAYIYPFVDPHQGFRYLLREIVVNLTSKYKGSKHSQLDLLAADIGLDLLERLAAEKSLTALKKASGRLRKDPPRILSARFSPKNIVTLLIDYGIGFFSAQYPSMDPDFLKVVLRYCFMAESRPAAIHWLMGRTVDAEYTTWLQVPDRSAKSAEALEEEAQSIIVSLDMLFLMRRKPMVVFFDQLENLSAGEQIQTFQKLVFCLGDKCRAMLPVAFFRGQDWQSRFQEKMDDFCMGRFKANLFDLKGCDKSQALELIRSRLGYVLDGIETPDDLYPFHPEHREELARMLYQEEMHPRIVINRANRLLQKILHGRVPEARDEDQIIKEAFKTRYQEVLANIDRYSPDEGRLTLALNLYLENRPADFAFLASGVERSDSRHKYIDLRATISPKGEKCRPAVFMIDVELHHLSVAASLKRGIAHLKENPGAMALYVRDARCTFHGPEKWKQNNALREELISLGGDFVLLDLEQVARLYALALLKFEIEAGDITSDTGAPIDSERLGHFIAGHIDGRAYDAFAQFDKYLSNGKSRERKEEERPEESEPAVKDVYDVVVCRSALILRNSPARMMKADLLAQKITEMANVRVGADRAVLILGEHKDRFRIFRAKDGVIVSLKEG